jgi:hypothetical protein
LSSPLYNSAHKFRHPFGSRRFCHSYFFSPTPPIKPFLVCTTKPSRPIIHLHFNHLATMMLTPPPNDFLCPLSKTVMHEPVSTPSGVNYERTAIEGWLCELSYCPIHGTPLTAQSLQANTSLQWKIRNWQKKNSSTTAETTVSAQHLSLSTPGTKKSTTPLQRFICPLTREIMQDPVQSKTGYSFERVALLKWLSLRGNEDFLLPILSHFHVKTFRWRRNKFLAAGVTLAPMTEAIDAKQTSSTRKWSRSILWVQRSHWSYSQYDPQDAKEIAQTHGYPINTSGIYPLYKTFLMSFILHHSAPMGKCRVVRSKQLRSL